jgi:hypothetical protein
MTSEKLPVPAVQLTVQLVTGQEISAEDIDSMARLLRDEIEQYPGTDDVRLKPDDNKPAVGTKSGAEAFTLGALLLGVLPEAIPAVIGYLQEWTLRPGNRPIKIKVQVADRSVELEFDPRITSKDDAVTLAREIQAMVAEQPEH